jgi:hypothetical protein
VKALAWSATAVWSMLFIGRALAFEPRDGDLWWQRALGAEVLRTHAIPRVLGPSTYTAPQAPWIPHEWLFGTALAWCASHGLDLEFRLALAACAAAAVVLVALRAMALGAGRIAGWAAAFGGIALLESFGVRAQVAAWPLLALFLLLAERTGRARLWAIPVVALWANVHASVVLAPVIAGCMLLPDRGVAPRGRLIFFGAVLLAMLCTPFGVALPLFVLRWSLDPDTAYLVEWARTSVRDWPVLAGAVVPALILLADARTRRLTWAQRAIALLSFVALVLHARNVAPAAIIIVPYAAVIVAALVGAGRSRPWSPSDSGLLALAAAGAVLIVALEIRLPPARYAARDAVAAVRAMPGAQRVYCENFSWCSLFAGDPRERVFLDGRTDAYPHAVFAAWARARAAAPGWEPLLAERGTTVILAGTGGVLARAASRTRRWRAAFAGPGITVFALTAE